MERSSFYSDIQTEEGAVIRCSYRVVREGQHSYGLICCQEGRAQERLCRLRNVSRHEETVEALASLLAEKQVLPVHIRDVLEDLMP